ncbi:acyclic terpene utilization AtuA family protein [Alcaligenaceae bacterium C4P045]|nr:acyclic terpene utilization AtuA family protein [Alcaligenaceae bacterium C4P045]
MRTIAVGAGAGFSGDRVDAPGPVVDTLIAHDGPRALIFEMLAERTLALRQLMRQDDPDSGYEPLLELELRPVLARCLAHDIPIVSNMGAANPRGAALHIKRLAQELGLPAPRIAVVEGDDMSTPLGMAELLKHLTPAERERKLVSANVYQGSLCIARALTAGAQIVITGRVADSALVLGPAMAAFKWREDQWDQLAGGILAGHLLECGAQVTGGYFADPGLKDVPDLHNPGFPIAEIDIDGGCVITKAAHTGGLVDPRTVKEQMLYEVHDPAAYITPDVVADFSEVEVEQIGPDRVRLTGVKGHPRTDTLKATVFFEGGWLGEGEISYAGPSAEARARLAADIIRKRMGQDFTLRFDLIGVMSILGDDRGAALAREPVGHATEVRLRIAAAHTEQHQIDRLLREVDALYTCGPAGGGGVRLAKRKRLSTSSCLIPREHVPASFHFVE